MDSYIRKSVTLNNSAQSDIESAKAIARKIFEIYDRDRSTVLENHEISPLLTDVYKSMNRNFTPSKLDVESYARVIDRNGDGRVTLQDVENLCIRYLVGEDAVNRSQAAGYTSTGVAGGYLQDGGETVKRSAYGQDYGNLTGSRTYENSGSHLGGEQVKRAGAQGDLRASGSGQIRILRRTQLEDIKRIFNRFDADGSGFIDEAELKTLLEETYKVLGVNRTITRDDVTSYLTMVDSNRDGKISPQEYEEIVIRSLEKNGIILE